MKKYTQKQVKEKEGVDVATVIRWTEAELSSRGLTKHGSGQGCRYTYEQDADINETVSNRENIDREGKILDNELKRQKLERTQRIIEKDYEDHIMENVYKFITGIKNSLQKCKLTPEQTKLVQNAIQESLESCESLLNS